MIIILIPDILILVFLVVILLPFALLGENLGTLLKIVTCFMFLPTLLSGIIAYFRFKELKERGEDTSGMLWKTFVIELLTAIAAIIGTYIFLSLNTAMGDENPGLFEGLSGAFGGIMSILGIFFVCCHYFSFLMDFSGKRLTPVKIALSNIIGSAVAFGAVMLLSQF